MAAPSSSEHSEVFDAISRFTDAVNTGDQAAAIGYFTEDASIIEDLAPFRWQGPTAGSDWLAAMWANAQAHGLSDIHMALGQPSRMMVEDGGAYAIVPGVLSLRTAGGPEHVDGVLTFAMVDAAPGWRIAALTWTGGPHS